MYIFSLLLFNVLVIYVKCYNLDFEYAVAKSGPENSFFGFSVAEHKDTINSKNWILVGAPKANNSGLQSRFAQSGTVFKCKPNDIKFPCTEQVEFDTETAGDDFSKANEWLGVSLKTGGESRSVVTCAHRYEYYGSSKKFRLLEGRCLGLGEDLVGGLPDFYSACTKENLDPSKTSDHEAYGQCQSGIGLDMMPGSEDVTNVLIGAAGTKWWSGEVFEMNSDEEKSSGVLPNNVQTDVKKSDSLGFRNSLFGYSVTHGNFLSKSDLHIAAGGPRHKHFGKVLIYEQKVRSGAKHKKLVQEIPKDSVNSTEKIQIASGFGIALCSIDSDNDGLSELIVGAPFHLSQNGKERPERGIVYIYSKSASKNALVFQKTIQGDENEGSYSNFGYAVANAGDINLDGYEDLVIGAPREEDGAGAVYIYFGTKKGVPDKFTQRIAASAVVSGTTDNIGLKGFGRSLGTGQDLDDNGYNDVLVGAYLSDQVALLRSRPIVRVSSKLEFQPNQIDTSGKKCDRNKVSSCTQVKLCFNVSEPSGKLDLKNRVIKVKYTIEADPIRGTIRKSRVQFEDSKSNLHSFIGNSSIQYKCQELGIISLVYNEDGTIVEYPDVMFRVSYEIPYGDAAVSKPARTDTEVVSLDNYPVLRQNVGDGSDVTSFLEMTAMLQFKRNCTICVPDLKISSAQPEYVLRLGRKERKVEITIENIGEDAAYSVGFIITLPKSLQLNEVKHNKRSIACPNNICQNVINKFNKGQKKTVTINLAIEHFDPEGEKNITIFATSANEEKLETKSNNKLEISFDLKVVADLELFTARSTRRRTYEGVVKGETAMGSLEDAGPIVRHKYVVRNNGPDLSPLANLTIYWPYETKSGKHLLYLVDIISSGNTKCVANYINVLNLKSDGSSSEASTGASTSGAGGPSVSVQSTHVVKKKRTRRDTTAGNNTAGVEPPTATIKRKVGRILNCTTARCLEIRCTLPNITNLDTRTIEIKSVLWKPSLLLDYRGEEVTVVSYGVVSRGLNATYISDPTNENDEQEEYTVVTPIIPRPREEDIKVWQIALAVVAGVILLALMIYGLYKVGFFHRTRKHDENGADATLLNEKKGGR